MLAAGKRSNAPKSTHRHKRTQNTRHWVTDKSSCRTMSVIQSASQLFIHPAKIHFASTCVTRLSSILSARLLIHKAKHTTKPAHCSPGRTRRKVSARRPARRHGERRGSKVVDVRRKVCAAALIFLFFRLSPPILVTYIPERRPLHQPLTAPALVSDSAKGQTAGVQSIEARNKRRR